MKRKFKILVQVIEQQKEEITSKDQDLLKEHFAHVKVCKDVKRLRNDITRVRKQILSSDQILSTQKDEVRKLKAIIQEADGETARSSKEFTAVVNERDILGAQLIRRNEELAKLYEKIKIQRSTLSKGEWQYSQTQARAEALKDALVIAKERLDYLKSNVLDLSSMKTRQYSLEKEILREKAKITALSTELERPMNIHRWRKLAGTDPKRFGLIQKIQRKQKQLLSKTQEVIERDLLIQEKERLYVELKNILARQPGPEVAEQLTIYEENLKEKRHQMKKMDNELDMYKHQVEELKHDIEQISERMISMKKDYFRKMRKQQQDMQIQQQQLHLEQQSQQHQIQMQQKMELFQNEINESEQK